LETRVFITISSAGLSPEKSTTVSSPTNVRSKRILDGVVVGTSVVDTDGVGGLTCRISAFWIFDAVVVGTSDEDTDGNSAVCGILEGF